MMTSRPSVRRVVVMLLAYAVLVGVYIASASQAPVWVRDLGRFYGLTVCALIFAAWWVIMRRSWQDYRRARAEGKDADLRLHIWLISTSFLGYVAASAWRTIELIGKPFEVEASPTMIYFGPMALYALWLFVKPSRTTHIRPDDRVTTTIGES